MTKTVAWHGVMDALPDGAAADLRAIYRAIDALADACSHKRLGHSDLWVMAKLHDAMAAIEDPAGAVVERKVRLMDELADAVEAKELAQ